MSPWLTMIGMGEGGIAALPPATRALLDAAAVVLGPERLLDALAGSLLDLAAPSSPSPLRGGTARSAKGGGFSELIPWAPPLDAMLAQIESHRGTPTVILATGDPMWFGIGATLSKRLRKDEFTSIPHPSAFQLAAARLGWPLQHVATLSLHGRPVELLHPHVLPANRILALTSDAATAHGVAALLTARGYGQSRMVALEHLGGPRETSREGMAREFDTTGLGDFYTLAIDCVADSDAPLLPPLPGLPDTAFMSDGQLTKRDVRAATLARLAPYPGALLWDVGAGCGSIAIEWMRAARDARAIAIEREGERAQMIALNAAALGTPALRIETGAAPHSLAGLPVPDAVFIGGAVADDEVFDTCWAALRPGGRLVANAVTLGGEAALLARHARLGGELTRIAISTLDRIGGEVVLRPKLPVLQWAVQKP